jgi:hypothetical protein
MVKRVIRLAQRRAAELLRIRAELASRPVARRILAAADSTRARRLSGTCAALSKRFASRTPCAGDVLFTPNVNGPAGGGQVRPNGPLAGAEGVGNEEATRSIAYWSPSQ